MSDLNPEYLKHSNIERVNFVEKQVMARGKYTNKELPCWIVFFNTVFDNTDYLIILDETGEPLYYQNFNITIVEIEKDTEGKYKIKND